MSAHHHSDALGPGPKYLTLHIPGFIRQSSVQSVEDGLTDFRKSSGWDPGSFQWCLVATLYSAAPPGQASAVQQWKISKFSRKIFKWEQVPWKYALLNWSFALPTQTHSRQLSNQLCPTKGTFFLILKEKMSVASRKFSVFLCHFPWTVKTVLQAKNYRALRELYIYLFNLFILFNFLTF